MVLRWRYVELSKSNSVINVCYTYDTYFIITVMWKNTIKPLSGEPGALIGSGYVCLNAKIAKSLNAKKKKKNVLIVIFLPYKQSTWYSELL